MQENQDICVFTVERLLKHAYIYEMAANTTSMLKTLIILLLLPFLGCSQAQKLLLQDYSFLVTDGEVTKLHQSNDTLYELHCYIDRPCQERPEKHYKIISSTAAEEFTILKLEQLDTIPLTTKPYRTTRYSVLALRKIDNKQLGYLPLVLGLTRQQLDTVQTNIQSLKEKFFFTFFSDTFLKELAGLKKITTKEDAQQIIETFKSDKFKLLVDSYSKTETSDIYASGLSAEILNCVCIEKQYSPIGAGLAIDSLMKR